MILILASSVNEPAPMPLAPNAKLWIDVEDLFEYRRHNPRPSGIQRVEYELCRSLNSLADFPDRVRFLRHDTIRESFYAIPYRAIEDLYSGMTTADGENLGASAGGGSDPSREEKATWRYSARMFMRRSVHRLPVGLRAPLIRFLFYQWVSFVAFSELLRAGFAGAFRRLTAGGRRAGFGGATQNKPNESLAVQGAGIGRFEREAAPGDLLVTLGSPWFHPSFAAVVKAAQQKYGLRYVLLVYDIIPLRRPEWCDKKLTASFGAFIRSVLPLADTLLTISRASASDLVRYASEATIALRTPPVAIPMGTGFTNPPSEPARLARSAKGGRTLPAPGSYALIVSTIEARKNHTLLFQVWRRLLDDLPAAEVPTLVFAGRIGWLVTDLMQQLKNANYLNGKIVLIHNPSDIELLRLYNGCLFTLFPSFYEGWGLPVTESLGFGRPCIVSNATSLPEAGGALARYFDPTNGPEAYSVIRDTIGDLDGLRLWQEAVARDFVPITWDQSARAIYDVLGVRNAVIEPV